MHHFLHSLFHPQAVAVVGASDRYASPGRSAFGQLLADCTAEQLIPVNPKHKHIGGRKSFATLSEACKTHPVDTAVVLLAPDKLGAIVREAAKLGIRQMVFVYENGQPPAAVHAKLSRAVEAARKAGIHLIALPLNGLRGLYAPQQPDGCIYIGHSADIADCLRSDADEHGIGFSRFLVLNPTACSVGIGSVIDFAAAETETAALLVHIGSIDDSRTLLSALAAAARSRPVVVLATLGNPQQAALLQQALARHPILQVGSLNAFLTAARLIHTGISAHGGRLSLVSNAPQISTLIRNNLPDGLEHAAAPVPTGRPSVRLLSAKNSSTPPPLDTDTVPAVFQAAVEAALRDNGNDAVLVVYNGQDNTESRHLAKAIAALQARYRRKPLLSVWLGHADSDAIRRLFQQQRSLHFRLPEYALHALTQLERYRSHRQQYHRIIPFYDYRRATHAADTLGRHLRPFLSLIPHPATKAQSHRFLEAAGITAAKGKAGDSGLVLQWDSQEPFGHVFSVNGRPLLPPVSAEAAATVLDELGEVTACWLPHLLDTAEICTRLPEIRQLRLHLGIDGNRVCCRDIKLSLQDPAGMAATPDTFAPYPEHSTQILTLANGQSACLRPLRPEDAVLVKQLLEGQSEQSRYLRLMSRSSELPPSLLTRLSRFDYAREFALILHSDDLTPLAAAAYNADAGGRSCEFGISIADSLQGQGIGRLLMMQLIAYARQQGYQHMRAEILSENHAMQKLALKLGFTLTQHPLDHNLTEAVLPLSA